MNEAKEKIQTAIESIEGTTKLFYQQRDKDGYYKLNHTILAIETAINEIDKLKDQNEEVHLYEQRIMNSLNNSMEALAVKDSVLLSDILRYEVGDQFREIVKLL